MIDKNRNLTFDLEGLSIRSYPDPVLRVPAQPVQEINGQIADLAERMLAMMAEADGIGLAAPQVGVPLRLFVVSLTGRIEDGQVFINPEVSGFQGMTEFEEGCLSVPGVRARVQRPAMCTVTAIDIDGNRFVVEAADMSARVVQHETDHLDGKLLIDRLSTVGRMACKRSLKQLEQDYQKQGRRA